VGGGILNSGTVRLVHSVVRDSVASFGGGIANRNTLRLINSTVTGNFRGPRWRNLEQPQTHADQLHRQR
jgi:hypothetical protein